GVDNRRITLIVIRARANSAVVVSLMEFVLVVLMEMEIKSIFQLRTLLINLQVSLTTPHTLSKSCVNFAGTILNIVTAVHLKASLSIQSQITALISIPRKICIIFNSKIFAVKIVGVLMRLLKSPKSPKHSFFRFDQLRISKPRNLRQTINLPQPMSMEALGKARGPKKSIESFLNKSYGNRPLVYCDNDDDEDYTIAITPESPTKEPVNSLSLGDEHLDTIPATESDEFIKSKIRAKSRTVSIDSSPKIDSLSNKFAGELILPKSIPPEIEEVEFDPEGDILFLESLLYDNSSPRPPEALQANSNAIESLPPSHIPVADNDSSYG
ncbi:hypothetical protein Tco_0252526, partial [Tanacetum coccineum]